MSLKVSTNENEIRLRDYCDDDGGDTAEILRPLFDDEVDELMKLYRRKFGTKNFHYLLFYNQQKWNQQLDADKLRNDVEWKSLQKTFYTHRNCNFRRYGTYVSLHYDLMQSVSFYSWQPTLQELTECLSQTKLIAWDTGPLLTNVDLNLTALAKQIALANGARVQRARSCHGFILPHRQALQLPNLVLPMGYALRHLQEADASTIHADWPNAKEGSLQFISGLIRYNKTFGVYRADDEEQTLVAWIFQNDFSGLGILQVRPEAQRQSLGISLATAMSKLIATTELVDLSVWVVEENFRSVALMQKIGYKSSVINEWIQLTKST